MVSSDKLTSDSNRSSNYSNLYEKELETDILSSRTKNIDETGQNSSCITSKIQEIQSRLTSPAKQTAEVGRDTSVSGNIVNISNKIKLFNDILSKKKPTAISIKVKEFEDRVIHSKENRLSLPAEATIGVNEVGNKILTIIKKLKNLEPLEGTEESCSSITVSIDKNNELQSDVMKTKEQCLEDKDFLLDEIKSVSDQETAIVETEQVPELTNLPIDQPSVQELSLENITDSGEDDDKIYKSDVFDQPNNEIPEEDNHKTESKPYQLSNYEEESEVSVVCERKDIPRNIPEINEAIVLKTTIFSSGRVEFRSSNKNLLEKDKSDLKPEKHSAVQISPINKVNFITFSRRFMPIKRFFCCNSS